LVRKLIIIPAFNEEENILKLLSSIQKEAPDYDYIVINDCSNDKTKTILEENCCNYIDLPINLGIGGAVQSGYRYARKFGYDIAVQIDADGQHDIRYLKEMEKQLEENTVDMVIGSRFINKDGFRSTLTRRIGIKYFSMLIRLCTGKRITDPTSGQRMAGRKIIARFAEDYPRDYPEPETVVMALRQGYKIKEIPVVMHERNGGMSSIKHLTAIYYMVKVTMAILMETTRGTRCHA